MPSASDWLQVAGYLLVFGAGAYWLYQRLPVPEAARESDLFLDPASKTPEQWGAIVDAHEAQAEGHSRMVADLAIQLADAVALAPEQRRPLEVAALLHDAGLVEFAPDLVQRAGALALTERFKLQEHAARGARLAFVITRDAAASQWVRWHHENWDGLGYPDGLAGIQIPLPARILRLADASASMLSHRPHRDALTLAAATEVLVAEAGFAFDPDLARVMADLVLPRYVAPLGNQFPLPAKAARPFP